METSSKTPAVGVRDAGFALLCVVSVAAILLAQFVSLIVFDTTGIDRYVPSAVIYSLVPAAIVTLIPGLVAVHQYNRQRAKWITAGVFLAAIVASLLTTGFFILG